MEDMRLKCLKRMVLMVLERMRILEKYRNFCRSGGTKRIHGLNPGFGSAWSAGPKLGLPRNYTGGTQNLVPPYPPDCKFLTDQVFEGRNDFRILKFFRKQKHTIKSDWEMTKRQVKTRVSIEFE